MFVTNFMTDLGADSPTDSLPQAANRTNVTNKFTSHRKKHDTHVIFTMFSLFQPPLPAFFFLFIFSM